MLRSSKRNAPTLLKWIESSQNSLLCQRGVSSALTGSTSSFLNDPLKDGRQRNSWESYGRGEGRLHHELPNMSRGFSASSISEASSNDQLNSGESQVSSGGQLSSDTDDLFSPDAISYLVDGAETHALLEAWMDAGYINIFNKIFQFLIEQAHSTTGLSWAASISLTTVFARIATIPLTIKQLRNTVNMTKARPELEDLATWYKGKQAEGLGKEFQQEYMLKMAQAWKKHDAHPLKAMLPLVAQFPIFVGFFGACRSMAAAQVPSMLNGGFPFPGFENLTLPSPYYALPILSSAIFLLSIELNAADGMQGQDQTTLKRTKNIMRGLGVLMIPLTASMPLNVFCYWITSNLFSLIQGTVFKLDRVRKYLNLPPMSQMHSGQALSINTIVSKPAQSFSPQSSQILTGKSEDPKPSRLNLFKPKTPSPKPSLAEMRKANQKKYTSKPTKRKK